MVLGTRPITMPIFSAALTQTSAGCINVFSPGIKTESRNSSGMTKVSAVNGMTDSRVAFLGWDCHRTFRRATPNWSTYTNPAIRFTSSDSAAVLIRHVAWSAWSGMPGCFAKTRAPCPNWFSRHTRSTGPEIEVQMRKVQNDSAQNTRERSRFILLAYGIPSALWVFHSAPSNGSTAPTISSTIRDSVESSKTLSRLWQ